MEVTKQQKCQSDFTLWCKYEIPFLKMLMCSSFHFLIDFYHPSTDMTLWMKDISHLATQLSLFLFIVVWGRINFGNLEWIIFLCMNLQNVPFRRLKRSFSG